MPAPDVVVSATAAFTEGSPAVALSPALTISDTNSTTLASATVSITGGTFNGDDDVLSATTTGTSISASYDSTTETLTLSGVDTLADYQAVLQSVAFTTTSANPTNSGLEQSRTVTWSVNDGTTTSAPATTTLSVLAPPVLSSVAATDSFTEGGAAITLSPSLTISDTNSTTLASATVSITDGTFSGDDDVLSATTTGTSISASYDSATETLTLTGTDSLADYQTVLDSVVFSSTSADPTNSSVDPTRIVTWSVNDGTTSSAPATTTLGFLAPFGPLQDGTFLQPIGTGFNLTPWSDFSDAGITQSPAPSGIPGNYASMPNAPNGGSDLFQDFSGPASGVYDLSFYVQDQSPWAAELTVLYQQPGGGGWNDLAAVVTLPASSGFILETLVVDVTNSAGTTSEISFSNSFNNPDEFPQFANSVNPSGTIINVADVSFTIAPPALSSVAATDSFTKGGAAVTLSPALTISDTNSTTLASATVSITGGTFNGDDDVLSATTTGTSISASYDSSTETLTLSGVDTLADYQAVLQSVAFTTTSTNPTNSGLDQSRTVTWSVNDGTTTSTPATTTLSVLAPPALSSVAATDSFTKGGAAVTLSPALTISDTNSTTLASATVSITGGTFNGDDDVLSATTTGTSISASYDSSTETLTLSGVDTLADYQAVLQSVAFTTTSTNPTNSGLDQSRTVTWSVNDGTTTSTPATTTLSVLAPPALSSVAATDSFTKGGAAVTLSPALTISDTNSTTLASATVSITGGTFNGDDDVLSATTTGTSISASYDSSTETLTLSGVDTLADYQAVLQSVAFTTTSTNPTNSGLDQSRTVTWSVNDGTTTSTPATTTLSVLAPPALSSVAATDSFTKGGAAVTLSPALTISDTNSTTLASATVSITGGTFNGDDDVLSATTTGTSISASYDSSTETLTLSGVDTLADYQAVLQSVAFTTTSTNPTNSGLDQSRTVTWSVNDGTTTSTPATTTLGFLAAGVGFTEVGNNYFLDNSGGSDPELSYDGAPIVDGETGGWVPIGAAQTSTGYDIAWKMTGADEYTVWSANSSGAYTVPLIGYVSGSSTALESLEPIFDQDLNGDGVIGLPPPTVIQTDGSTSLVQAGSNYFLYGVGTTSGPELTYDGAAIVDGETAGWVPIGAVQTASGYDVAWEIPGANEYTVWSTNSSGAYTGPLIGYVSGSSTALESLEPVFNQDLNGDGVIGLPPPTVIQTDGSTSLVQAGSNYFLYGVGTTSGPELTYDGAAIVDGETAGWVPIGAVQTASGYDVAWEIPGANEYTVWSTNSSGAYTGPLIGYVSGSSTALESLEPVFNQDLNGDGVIGLPPPTVIQTDGSTSLVQAGSNYFLYGVGTTSGPELTYDGAAIVDGETAGWVPIGAVQTASGYDVAWEIPGANEYTVWSTNSSGAYTGPLIGFVSGSSAALESLEPVFNQDLNGDGVIGETTIAAGTTTEIPSAYSGTITFAGSTGTLQLDSSSSFNGTVAGLAGQDTLDLRDINSAMVQTPIYSGNSSGGVLTVTDGTHTAQIALLGNYLASTFVASADGHGGTAIVDPVLTAANQQMVLTQPQHT